MFKNAVIARSLGTRALCLCGAAVSLAVIALAVELPLIKSASHLAPIFRILFADGDSQGAWVTLAILLAAALSPIVLSPRPLLHWLGTHPRSVAFCGALVLSACALVVYQNVRLSMDEYAQFFQSQIFAAGHIAGRFPSALLNWLIPLGFQDFFLNVSRSSGETASAYWPSFALLLTPFTWLGIPWACNPVISGLTLWVVHRITLRIFNDVEIAGLAVLLTLASPVFFADGISYYAMSAHLLANAVFALLLMDQTPRRAFLAGIVGSVALTLHNPVPHALFAAPWIVWLLVEPTRRRAVLWLFAGYLPLCLLLGVGWFVFSSHLAHEGMAAAAGAEGIVDSADKILAIARLPTASVWLARLIGVAKIWAWSVPGLLLLAIYGAWQGRRNPWCALLSASALLTLVMYVFVPVDQGHGWGYRYFHSAWLALPILGAAAFAKNTEQVGSRLADQGALTFVVLCALLSLCAGTGLRAFQMHHFIAEHQQFLPHYVGTAPSVFILDPHQAFYGYDLVQNDPWLRWGPIKMISRGAAADEGMMRDYFPGLRRVYEDRYGSVWSTQ
jgi:hypothetical protein